MQVLNKKISHELLHDKNFGLSEYEIYHFLNNIFAGFPKDFADIPMLDKPLSSFQFTNGFKRNLSILKDCIIGLTQDDIEFMILQSQRNNNFYWNKYYLPGKKLVSSDLIGGIIEEMSIDEYWKYIHDHIGAGYCVFSLPFFTQSKLQAFIEYSFYFDSLFSYGGFTTYISNIEGGWMIFENVITWRS